MQLSEVQSFLNGALMLNQLQELGRIGFEEHSCGRTRLALSDADKQGRDLLIKWMKELNLEICIDRIGNIFGTMSSANNDSSLRPLMIGSHIDTVINAGALDGCYGVLAGLAVIRAFRSAGLKPKRPLTVVAFTNEEGVRYQPDMMGSLVYAGGADIASILNTIGTDGTRLGDELERIGYAGDMEPGVLVPHEYLELHIEQGPVLEAENFQCGAVENLQGISWQEITVTGTANHAGTTPTYMRHDAGYVASSIVTHLRHLAMQGNTLATVGTIRFEPSAINVIPGKAILTVDIRNPCEKQLQEVENKLKTFLISLAEREGVKISSRQLVRFEPVNFSEDIVNQISSSAAKLGLRIRSITSGAGHDAQMIARIAPTAMIFVPSKNGISHNPSEFTSEEDLINGVRLLLEVITHRL